MISEEWKAYISVDESGKSAPYTAKVYAKCDSGKVLLFTIGIGTNGTNPIGYVTSAAKTYDICVTIASPSMNGWSENDKQTVYTLQEEINSVMDQFRAMTVFSETNPGVSSGSGGSAAEEDKSKPFTLLDTPVGSLEFPGKLENKVYADENTSNGIYKAEFYGECESGDALLFTVLVNYGRVDSRVGFVPSADDETVYLDVCVEIANPSMNGWSEADKTLIHSMQESVNDIMDQICDLDGFNTELPGEGEYDENIHGSQNSPGSSQTPEENWGEFLLLDTPIGEFTFSEKWEDRIYASQSESGGNYTAVIYAKMSGGDVELFRIIIGAEQSGNLIGEIDGKFVCFAMDELTKKSALTDAQFEELLSMQEGVNDICDQICGIAE